MECESVNESTMDSIDVTIFEDFYSLDITMPFSCEPPKTAKTQQPDSKEIVSVPASPAKSTRSSQITSSIPPNEPLPISPELIQTPTRSESTRASQSELASKEPDEALESSPNSPSEYSSLSPIKSEYKSNYGIPSESASNMSVASSPESPTLSMEFFTSVLSMSPKNKPEAIPLASPKKTPVSFRSSGKLQMSESIDLKSNTKVTPGMSRSVSCRKRIVIDEPLIAFSPDVFPQTLKPSTSNRTISSTNCSNIEMKENKVPTKLPNRYESPTEIHKSLLLHQVSGRTNHSPIYTPFTSMVSRFKNLAIESPFVPAGKVNVSNESSKKADQHKTRVEKIKLISPLLRSPKLKIISTKHPLRSNSKVTNLIEKKSPTSAQYKAKSPVTQGSRIPVLKLN